MPFSFNSAGKYSLAQIELDGNIEICLVIHSLVSRWVKHYTAPAGKCTNVECIHASTWDNADQ